MLARGAEEKPEFMPMHDRSKAPQLVTGNRREFGGSRLIHGLRGDIAEDDRSRADDTALADGDVIAKRCIHSDKTTSSNMDAARNDGMRSDETIVLDG